MGQKYFFSQAISKIKHRIPQSKNQDKTQINSAFIFINLFSLVNVSEDCKYVLRKNLEQWKENHIHAYRIWDHPISKFPLKNIKETHWADFVSEVWCVMEFNLLNANPTKCSKQSNNSTHFVKEFFECLNALGLALKGLRD